MRPDPFSSVTPPLDGRAFSWSVGVRPIDIDEWLVIDEHRISELHEKDDLLERNYPEFVATLPEGLEASHEFLEMLVTHLVTHHSDVFEVVGSEVRDVVSGRVVDVSADHPIDSAGRMVAEDFVVMSPANDKWLLTAGSVCFATQWKLEEKIGRELTAIHDPVPGYESRLGVAVEKFFNRLQPEQLFARSNWGLINTPAMYLGDRVPRPLAPGADPGTGMWIRTERQTFRKLPRSGAVVFSILVQITSLKDLPVPRRRQLAATLKTVPTDIATYKGWQGSSEQLIRWCEVSE